MEEKHITRSKRAGNLKKGEYQKSRIKEI